MELFFKHWYSSTCRFLLQDGEAYVHLLNAVAPELGATTSLDVQDPTERAKMIIEQAEKLDCKRYVTPKDIVDGSTNLNLAFVAQIFQHRLVSNLTLPLLRQNYSYSCERACYSPCKKKSAKIQNRIFLLWWTADCLYFIYFHIVLI